MCILKFRGVIYCFIFLQVLVALSNPSQSFSILTLFSLGTPFAWKVVLSFYAWGFISLKVPSKVFKGPPTPNGYVPLYAANGLQYYFLSLVLFLIFTSFGYQTLCTVGHCEFQFTSSKILFSAKNIQGFVICLFQIEKWTNAIFSLFFNYEIVSNERIYFLTTFNEHTH